MVALRDVRSDFFQFDDEHYRLVGRRTHMVYNLGDPVRIRVKKANQEQCLLDYELVEPDAPERAPRLQGNPESREDSRRHKGESRSGTGHSRKGWKYSRKMSGNDSAKSVKKHSGRPSPKKSAKGGNR